MAFSKAIWAGGLAVAMGSAIFAAKTDTAAPAADTPAPHHGHGRLTKPWSELKDLTDDEKTKILAIHQKAIDEIHDIEAKEHEDILATLTGAQKKEVADLETKEKEAAHAHHGATTKPSAGSGA
jgi:Spy/CpxP family protein refolding chaperone